MLGAGLQIIWESFLHNVLQLRQWAPQSRLLAMVKADAYGHGLAVLAPGLETAAGIDMLGVARLEEALALREAGVRKPIVLMEGFVDPAELPLIAAHRLTTVLHHESQLAHLRKAPLGRSEPLPVWLKMNTGMNRLGFQPQAVITAAEQCRAHLHDKIRLSGVMTHFAKADSPGDPMNTQQIQCFQRTVSRIPALQRLPQSLANSAALLADPRAHADWVRPGIALYGISPFAATLGADWGLKPVMRFFAHVIATYSVAAGETVGYGATYRAESAIDLAVVAVGYGDGYPVAAPCGTPVYLGNTICPLVGRVAMDMITVDITRVAQAVQVGDLAVLWGPELPLETVAEAIGVIPWSLCCGVTQRVRRTVLPVTATALQEAYAVSVLSGS